MKNGNSEGSSSSLSEIRIAVRHEQSVDRAPGRRPQEGEPRGGLPRPQDLLFRGLLHGGELPNLHLDGRPRPQHHHLPVDQTPRQRPALLRERRHPPLQNATDTLPSSTVIKCTFGAAATTGPRTGCSSASTPRGTAGRPPRPRGVCPCRGMATRRASGGTT
jgi:hypothetical protein